MTKKFEIIKVSGIAMGVGFIEKLKDGSGFYSESICETLFNTGNDKKDAAESKKWATIICNALNPPSPQSSEIEYWKKRCEAAERLMNKDLSKTEHDEDYNKWQAIKQQKESK